VISGGGASSLACSLAFDSGESLLILESLPFFFDFFLAPISSASSCFGFSEEEEEELTGCFGCFALVMLKMLMPCFCS